MFERVYRPLFTIVALALLFVGGCDRGYKPLGESLGENQSLPANGLPPTPFMIDATGAEYRWHIRYPGRDAQLYTPDDVSSLRDIHLPVHTTVQIQLQSTDYLYIFSLPHLGLTQIAVPDMMFSLEFETDSVETFDLQGDQLCGFSHPSLMGKIIVESRQDFEAWLYEKREQ